MSLHPRNPHQGRYDLTALAKTCPALQHFLVTTPANELSIDFANPEAVRCLNQALLAHYYHVVHWQIPAGYLCPPIPGRADYIHYLADLLAQSGHGSKVRILDIGTGANCIYPIIGSQSYGWQFVGTDIDAMALKTAQLIVQSNPCLTKLIKLRLQHDAQCLFKNVIQADDYFDATLCNPPFYASMEQAQAANTRKVQNLRGVKTVSAPALNFGGQAAELWCVGGELGFLKRMVQESAQFAKQVGWFTSLVSNGDHINPLKKCLQLQGASDVRVIAMSQGQKISRLIAWRFA